MSEDAMAGDRAVKPLVGMAALAIGGGGAICSESALRLLEDGAAVMLMDKNADVLGPVADRLRAAVPSGRVETFVGDGLSADDLQAALDAAKAMIGTLHMIVSSVGGGRFKPLLMHDLGSFMRTVELNIVPTFLAIRYGAPMLERGGSITCVSSNAAGNVTPWMSPYMVGKAGVEQLIRAAGEELGAAGIRANAVRPGLTMTEQGNSSSANPKVVEDVIKEVPLGRIGRPQDIAAAIRYLAGPEASWVTGQVIAIDGGGTLRKNPANMDALVGMYGQDAVDAVLAGKVPECD